MRHRKAAIRSSIAAVLIAPLLLSGCTGDSGKTPGDRPELTPVTFQLDFIAAGNNSPYYLALERGYYEDEGLDVTLREGKGSFDTMQVVGAGQADMGYTSGDAFVRGVSEGIPLTAVGWIQRRFANGIMVDKDNNEIQTLKDLYGHSLLFAPAGSDQFHTEAAFAINGLDIGQVEMIATEPAAKFSQWLAGQGDALFTISYFQALIQDRPTKALNLADYGVNTLGFGVVVNDRVLESRPEIVAPFLRATYRGFKDAQSDPRASVQAMQKALPDVEYDVDKHVQQLEMFFDFIETDATAGWPIGCMSYVDWQDTLDINKTYGPQGNLVDNIHDYWTNEHMENCPDDSGK